ALDRAAQSPAIKALVVRLGGASVGFARVEELTAAVRRFRAAGKPAYVYADDLGGFGDGTRLTALAAAFDEVWMAPSGSVGLTGVALETPYFSGALNELGVTAEFEQRYEFKGGADPMTRSDMSGPIRQSLSRLVDGLLDHTVASIAADRGLTPEKVRTLVDGGPYLGREAVAAGLIDRLDYPDAFDAYVKTLIGADAKWIDAPFLMAATQPDPSEDGSQPVKVAVVYGVGPIGVEDSLGGPFGDPGFDSDGLIETLNSIAKSKEYAAVLFRVDSPGGAYGPSDAVWHAVGQVQAAGIPVVVSMGDVAASGGYFVSVSADQIVAYPSTITGSIGVYGGKFDASALWSRLGVNWERVTAGQNAGMWSFNRGFSASERERFATAIDFVYEDFTSKVAKDRGFDAAKINAVARGRIWLGSQALDAGLVDRLGGFAEAEAAIRDLLGLNAGSELDLHVLPKPKSPFEAIAEALQSGDFSLAFGTLIADAAERRIMSRVEAVLGDLDGIAAPREVLSAPPMRFRN
ncbi:MAG: signal peptide peptidase SppA, partial [Alphaproteobacteria bacterium]|nr:signal peptide peptidase SppA [Alphaproteobacteria bacterium]